MEKIISDLQFVVDHTKSKKKEEIEKDEVLLDSVMFRIIQVAENSSKLTDNFKNSHSEIPWYAIRGMRNNLVHDYGRVRLDIVYDTVKVGIPQMLELLKGIQ